MIFSQNMLYAVCFMLIVTTPSNAQQSYAQTPQGQAFIDEVSGQFGYDKKTLNDIFSRVYPDEEILRKISRPKEKTTPWFKYRRIFLDDKRIQNGAKFYHDNKQILNEAYEKYGVSPLIITAIIGVETRYSKIMGKDSVIRALSTIAFDYPKRSPFFTKELRAFLQMVSEEKLDLFAVKGSYAGAMGMAQFMPSSYLNFAIDYEGDGKRDLWGNPHDAIFSIANYLAEHGWERDGDIADTATLETLYQDDVHHRPFTTLQVLKAQGVRPNHVNAYTDDTRVGYLVLEGENGDMSWVTFNNFGVITTYNTSPMYAMAVRDLALAIEMALTHEK